MSTVEELEALVDVSSSIPCEAPGHGQANTWSMGTLVMGHQGGEAVWRETANCPECSRSDTRLVCTVRRSAVRLGQIRGLIGICATCGDDSHYLSDWTFSWEKL